MLFGGHSTLPRRSSTLPARRGTAVVAAGRYTRPCAAASRGASNYFAAVPFLEKHWFLAPLALPQDIASTCAKQTKQKLKQHEQKPSLWTCLPALRSSRQAKHRAVSAVSCAELWYAGGGAGAPLALEGCRQRSVSFRYIGRHCYERRWHRRAGRRREGAIVRACVRLLFCSHLLYSGGHEFDEHTLVAKTKIEIVVCGELSACFQ